MFLIRDSIYIAIALHISQPPFALSSFLPFFSLERQRLYSVYSLWKNDLPPPAQRFDVQAANKRSPIQVLIQRQAACLGGSPGTGHLPHTERWRSYFRVELMC